MNNNINISHKCFKLSKSKNNDDLIIFFNEKPIGFFSGFIIKDDKQYKKYILNIMSLLSAKHRYYNPFLNMFYYRKNYEDNLELYDKYKSELIELNLKENQLFTMFSEFCNIAYIELNNIIEEKIYE